MTGDPRQRIDKWLWCARIVKTRSLAQTLVASGNVRLNRLKISKPGHGLAIGDTLTVSLNGRVRVLEVVAGAARRGTAAEAALLYAETGPGISQSRPAQKEDASGP